MMNDAKEHKIIQWQKMYSTIYVFLLQASSQIVSSDIASHTAHIQFHSHSHATLQPAPSTDSINTTINLNCELVTSQLHYSINTISVYLLERRERE